MTIPGWTPTSRRPVDMHELAKMDGFSRTALAMFYVDDYLRRSTNDNIAWSRLRFDDFPGRMVMSLTRG